MNMLWFFLPGIIYLGIITSYTDIRYGKIRNRDVVRGITYALFVYASLIIYFLFKGQLNYYYLIELGSNTLFALSVAFGLWHFKIWSAGDGKLFLAFAMLIPFDVYRYGNYNWIPSLTLLFNVFIVGLLAMIFLIIKNARPANYKKMFSSSFKKIFEPKNLFEMIVSLFAIFWLVQIALSFVGLGNNLLLKYVLTILVLSMIPAISFKFLSKKSKFKLPNLKLTIMVAITGLRLVVDKSVYSLQFLVGFLILIFVWMLLRRIFREGLQSLGKDLFSRGLPVKALKPGMILSDPIVKVERLSKNELKGLAKKDTKVINKGKFSYVLGDSKKGKDYIDAESEGLTKEHIRKIKNLGLKKIKISSTIPFAPLLFFGVIATLLIKGNILILRHFLFG